MGTSHYDLLEHPVTLDQVVQELLSPAPESTQLGPLRIEARHPEGAVLIAYPGPYPVCCRTATLHGEPVVHTLSYAQLNVAYPGLARVLMGDGPDQSANPEAYSIKVCSPEELGQVYTTLEFLHQLA